MSSSKKFDLQRDFAAGVYLSEAHNPLTPPPPPHRLHTLYVYTVQLFTLRGLGGRIEPEKG